MRAPKRAGLAGLAGACVLCLALVVGISSWKGKGLGPLQGQPPSPATVVVDVKGKATRELAGRSLMERTVTSRDESEDLAPPVLTRQVGKGEKKFEAAQVQAALLQQAQVAQAAQVQAALLQQAAAAAQDGEKTEEDKAAVKTNVAKKEKDAVHAPSLIEEEDAMNPSGWFKKKEPEKGDDVPKGEAHKVEAPQGKADKEQPKSSLASLDLVNRSVDSVDHHSGAGGCPCTPEQKESWMTEVEAENCCECCLSETDCETDENTCKWTVHHDTVTFKCLSTIYPARDHEKESKRVVNVVTQSVTE